MILALDLGSTSFKAAVVDGALRILGIGHGAIRHRYRPGGRVELDPSDASEALGHAIRAALKESAIGSNALKAVGLTSQAQTFTVTDTRGRPRIPFISWQDSRARTTCAELAAAPGMADIPQHSSFGSLIPALQICQLHHLQSTRPGMLKARAGTRVLPLPSFFVREWTGAYVTDDNQAAMTGLFSLATGSWWPTALRNCQLEETQLPKVVPIGSVAGLTGLQAKSHSLPEGIPVILAGNDQTAGAVAAGLDRQHGLLITLGTAQVAYAFKSRLPGPDPALIRGPYPGGGFYSMAADSCGGNVLNWARSVIAGCETEQAFFELAALAPPGCNGLVLKPVGVDGAFSWENVGLNHIPSDFARSVIECLTSRMSLMVRNVTRNRPPARILVAGGGSASRFWIRLLQQAVGAKLTQADAQPVLGAARIALANIALPLPLTAGRRSSRDRA